jgi:hypothetical protein
MVQIVRTGEVAVFRSAAHPASVCRQRRGAVVEPSGRRAQGRRRGTVRTCSPPCQPPPARRRSTSWRSPCAWSSPSPGPTAKPPRSSPCSPRCCPCSSCNWWSPGTAGVAVGGHRWVWAGSASGSGPSPSGCARPSWSSRRRSCD